MSFSCHFRQIPKNSINVTETSPRRCGRYLKSMFNFEGFGHTRWLVGCYIDIDYSKYVEDLGEEQFIKECIDHLNEPPKRERFQRTPRQALYGKLELHSYKLRETNGVCFIEIELITDARKNENFWGEGIKFDTGRKRHHKKTRDVSQGQQY